jgi:hypothetical protein
MAESTPFTYKSFPVCPGAYLVNTTYGAFPIFCNLSNLGNAGSADCDNKYIVMPGYKLIVYENTLYEGNSQPIENTSATNIKITTSNYPDKISSCRLYYNSNEIDVSGVS